MLKILRQAERDALPWLSSLEGWNTVDVDYSEPRVQRLWRPYKEDYRLFLHRIHPCDTPLYHPHPWPSAMRVLTGRYKMRLGYGDTSDSSQLAATIVMSHGATYEMVDPKGWHSVQPLDDPLLSIMVTGKPWGNAIDYSKPKSSLPPLSDKEAQEVLSKFRNAYHYIGLG